MASGGVNIDVKCLQRPMMWVAFLEFMNNPMLGAIRDLSGNANLDYCFSNRWARIVLIFDFGHGSTLRGYALKLYREHLRNRNAEGRESPGGRGGTHPHLPSNRREAAFLTLKQLSSAATPTARHGRI